MPSATPLPRGPSGLALFGAADLLTLAGCPVCRYAAEADDRFLTWFALKAHGDHDMITRLRASLGLCPAHTRGLLSQPGADRRLTVVYRYLLQAGVTFLTDATFPRADCPACAHRAEAAARAVDVLLDGLEGHDLRERYRDRDGLCLPHLRDAVGRGKQRVAGWLAGEATARLAARRPGLAMLAGQADADADVRARLRAALPPASSVPARPGSDEVCRVCLTAAQAERDVLVRAAGRAARGAGGGRRADRSGNGLCPAHLQETCSGLAHGQVRAAGVDRMLARQAGLAVTWLGQVNTTAGPLAVFSALARRRRGSGEPAGSGACQPCRARHDSAGLSVRRLAEELTPQARDGPAPMLCLRHVLSLRREHPRAAAPVVRMALRRTEALLAELEEAFRKQTWAHRHAARGAEMTAWRRAAALVDGRVYGGGPIRTL